MAAKEAPVPEQVAAIAETDYTKAILWIADANLVIKEKKAEIESLDTKEALLISEIKRYEVSREEIKQDAEKERIILEKLLASKAEVETHQNTDYAQRMAELDTQEADLAVREQVVKDTEITNEKSRDEAQKLIDANVKAQAEVDSKLSEAKHLSSGRKEELHSIEAERAEAEIAMAQMEVQRAEITKLSEEYTALYARVQESQANAEKLHADIEASRALAQTKIEEARTENNSAEYNKGMATLLTASFRQALHTYCQISGTAVQIPELTNEHKQWIADDLIRQISE